MVDYSDTWTNGLRVGLLLKYLLYTSVYYAVCWESSASRDAETEPAASKRALTRGSEPAVKPRKETYSKSVARSLTRNVRCHFSMDTAVHRSGHRIINSAPRNVNIRSAEPPDSLLISDTTGCASNFQVAHRRAH